MAASDDQKINNFAIRSFRDVADADYIAARMAFRADLMPQFLWAGQQAIEKYLKAILCFYRVPAADVKHDIPEAMERLKLLPFEIDLSKTAVKTIAHIGAYGPFRYLEAPWHVMGHMLPRFDCTIWEIRRYCQAVNHAALAADGTDPEVMLHISTSDIDAPTRFEIPGGRLEQILASRDNPAREPLIWRNAYFGSRTRKTVKSMFKMSAANPPLSIYPEILPKLQRLVYIPSAAVQACRQLWGPKQERRRANLPPA